MPQAARLTPAQASTVELIRNTATSLWDVSEVATATQTVDADDWEMARVACSHLLAALEHPPAPTPLGKPEPTIYEVPASIAPRKPPLRIERGRSNGNAKTQAN